MYPKFWCLITSFFTLIAAASLPAADGQSSDITDNSLAAINAKTYSIHVDIPFYTTDASGNFVSNGTFSGMAGLKCETSLASPWVWEIEAAANRLDHGGWCHQFNGGGSFCTEWSKSGTAQIGLCGTLLVRVRCHELAWAAGVVRNQCAWNDHAGGQWRFPDIKGMWGKAIVY